MSTLPIKAAFQQAIDNWNKGNLAAYLELYDSQIVLHGFPPGLPPGAAGAALFYEGVWRAFPTPQLMIDQVVVEGDTLACRYRLQATHQGEFMGVPATGNAVVVPGMTMLRFADGKCIERWNQADMLGWLQQLGAVPA